MLTRIISAIVMIAIVVAVLFTNTFTPIITVLFLAGLAAVAVVEILYNTSITKSKGVVAVASITTFLATVAYWFYPQSVIVITVIYVLFVVICTVAANGEIAPASVAAIIAFPIILAYAFSCIYTVFGGYGFAYLLVIVNCSCICDAGAYFVGVTMGKHKLCPKISPKKTIEGAIGGIVLSEIVTVAIVLIAHLEGMLLPLMIITFLLCIVGMLGDLFASVIKRAAGIKDYGNVIPGHGGILDRFDSILLIAPVFVQLLRLAEVIKL